MVHIILVCDGIPNPNSNLLTVELPTAFSKANITVNSLVLHCRPLCPAPLPDPAPSAAKAMADMPSVGITGFLSGIIHGAISTVLSKAIPHPYKVDMILAVGGAIFTGDLPGFMAQWIMRAGLRRLKYSEQTSAFFGVAAGTAVGIVARSLTSPVELTTEITRATTSVLGFWTGAKITTQLLAKPTPALRPKVG